MFPFLDLFAQLRLRTCFDVDLDFRGGHREIDDLIRYAGKLTAQDDMAHCICI